VDEEDKEEEEGENKKKDLAGQETEAETEFV
jgi:hypothetical protein